ncbi:NAD(P)/FAD-dependent oxidoreductase [Piscinibacter sp. HJYY11]|uniref:flavin-containing monooxygenase n=1 Tax=Piscinibacter sp. HJYY11 TaxID=2801333 RepID=UPI00191CAB42|nr:NAD(P)/FAD-dependent oxidoreductase [Piscinibacter sp. HJYY11]MBL0726420.1 NAD(P)/FAD-dependent oxidoreductase [Piscinibacter sp. HJYY11]
MSTTHTDVLIVGAGLSGIGAACHLKRECPDRSVVILEGREAIGGTWDLFRYPGIRSDSDMYTLGYRFKPWTHAKAIADGPTILQYIRETAAENGIDKQIRFGHKVVGASWSTPDARWTVEVERHDGERATFTCNFLFMCSGYYRYDGGYLPDFPGIGQYAGRVVHPQKWTPDIDYAGKRVVVIGSGATAVTLVPEMARTAAHVTMLQRSPTYVVSRPAQDRIANALRKVLPVRWAYFLTRWKNIALSMYFYRLCKRRPAQVKRYMVNGVQAAIGSKVDVARHFTPRYNPWDQRLCLVPDGDLFRMLYAGKASVVTDEIERFTHRGLLLKSGTELEADLVVTATGLVLTSLDDMDLRVDGRQVEASRTFGYKGLMYSDVPNFAVSFGYTNASWTLKCDLTCEYVCRLLKHMQRHGHRQATPRNHDPELQAEPWIDFTSGYVQRAAAHMPKQGSKAPWKLYQNYVRDLITLRFGRIDDGVMEFSRPAR